MTEMPERQPLGFGVSLWLDEPIDRYASMAAAAESAGFDSVWVPDHYFLRDAFVALALMAAATERVQLGTAVAAVQLRHPSLLASAAATVDELAGGRVALGLGVGGFEFSAHFDMRPQRPLTLARESVAMARGLFSGTSDLEGHALTARGAKLGWEARPSLPIMLAARGTKMMELAGEAADGVMVHGITTAHLDHIKAHVAAGAERAGRPADACEIIMLLDIELDHDEAASIDRLRPRLEVMAGGSYSDDLIELYGIDPADVQRLRASVTAGEPGASQYVTDEMVRAFALPGDTDAVVDGCRRLHEAGVSRVVTFPRGTAEERIAHMDGLRPVIAQVSQTHAEV